MKINLIQYKDVEKFHKRVHSFLLKNETANNLPLGLLNGMKTSNKYKDPLLLLVENESDLSVVGAFIMTPPHFLVSTLEVEREDVLTVAKALFQFCKKSNMTFPGIIAEKNTALLLTHAWCDITGESYSVRMNQRIYQLNEVNPIPLSEGKMVKADTKDIEQISKWLLGFIDDTGELAMSNPLERAKEMVENEQSVYLWVVDNHPVSMARGGRMTDNGITVNLVYTPKEFRGKGYASSVVAELSRQLLKKNSYCSLYTDLDNPTSNKIYMNIGYKPICDSIMVTLK